jgi:hypothetical protein
LIAAEDAAGAFGAAAGGVGIASEGLVEAGATVSISFSQAS